MEVLNMRIKSIDIRFMHKFVMHCLVNQTILELHVVHMIAIIFHCAHPSRFDEIVLFLRSN